MSTDNWRNRSLASSSETDHLGDLSEADVADLYQPRTIPGRKRKKKEGVEKMPIPRPQGGEDARTFHARCIGAPAMQEYDAKQRNAVCYSAWTQAKKEADPVPQDAGIRKAAGMAADRAAYLYTAFDHAKPLNDATLGEYSEALHTGWKRDDPFRKHVEEFLGQPFAKLSRLEECYPAYRANLFRFGLRKTVPAEQILAITNYGYEEETPPGYMAYSTGDETIDGVQEATLSIQRPGGRLVARIAEGMGGVVYCMLFGTDKDKLLAFLGEINDGIAANNFLKGKKLFWNGAFIKPGQATWNDIILPDGFRETIEKNVIQFLQPERLETLKAKGLPLKRGLLIYGPPGNGKSLLGKVLATEVPCTFVWVPYGANFEHVYQMARELAPSVVLLEDLASQGGMDRRGGLSSYDLGKLLNLLDGVEENTGVVTVATENFVGHLDLALRNRPGRFDLILHLDNPAGPQREGLLKRYLPEFAVGQLAALAALTEGFSCAHLRELVNRILIEDATPDMYDALVADMRDCFAVDAQGKKQLDHLLEDD